MSALTSPTGPMNATTIPLVTPQPDVATPIPSSIPLSPVGTSTAPPLTSAQTLYDTTVQGDVDPSALLPPDFDIDAWAPALYAKTYSDYECNDCYADEYKVQPFGPAYYAHGGDGDFEVLPWAWGTGPKSYYTRGHKRGGHPIFALDIKLPLVLVAGGLGLAAIGWYYCKKKRKCLF